jgi:hypothetical protein
VKKPVKNLDNLTERAITEYLVKHCVLLLVNKEDIMRRITSVATLWSEVMTIATPFASTHNTSLSCKGTYERNGEMSKF